MIESLKELDYIQRNCFSTEKIYIGMGKNDKAYWKRVIAVPCWIGLLIRDLEITNKEKCDECTGFVGEVYDFKVYMSNSIETMHKVLGHGGK